MRKQKLTSGAVAAQKLGKFNRVRDLLVGRVISFSKDGKMAEITSVSLNENSNTLKNVKVNHINVNVNADSPIQTQAMFERNIRGILMNENIRVSNLSTKKNKVSMIIR